VTVRKGVDWGERRAVPIEVRRVPDDRALHEWICAHRVKGLPIGDVAITGGDLARTLGGANGSAEAATYAPLDVVRVVADGSSTTPSTTWCAAHVVARRSWWTGELLVAMNAEFLGELDIAPRAHPGDGVIDVVTVDPAMSLRTRRQARHRARLGAHLPHPQITVRRTATLQATFRRSMTVWVDGVRWCQATTLELQVEPDAYHAYV
jgi:hypothetical protein